MLYHFCTNGLKKSLIFSSDEDYIRGMNAIAISKVKYPEVEILAFCLMSNHVHFILACTERDGLKFMRHYKLQIGSYLRSKYGQERNLTGADIGSKVLDNPEYTFSAIAYVLRNPIAAGITISPTEYRWSSACLYFGNRIFCNENLQSISTITRERLRKLTNSHCAFCNDWHIDDNGMIFPGDYTDYEKVEKIFGRPSQLLYYLSKNNDTVIEADTGILSKCKYSDKEILASRDTLIEKVFHKKSISMMSIENKISLASMLRKRYGLSIPTLGRVTGLDRELLRQLL